MCYVTPNKYNLNTNKLQFLKLKRKTSKIWIKKKKKSFVQLFRVIITICLSYIEEY